jgi:hypothetical protein
VTGLTVGRLSGGSQFCGRGSSSRAWGCDRDHQLDGSLINKVQGQTVFPRKLAGIAPGARVFRNHDHAFAAEIAKSRPRRKIAVDGVLREIPEEILLEAIDEDSVRATATLVCAVEKTMEMEILCLFLVLAPVPLLLPSLPPWVVRAMVGAVSVAGGLLLLAVLLATRARRPRWLDAFSAGLADHGATPIGSGPMSIRIQF